MIVLLKLALLLQGKDFLYMLNKYFFSFDSKDGACIDNLSLSFC